MKESQVHSPLPVVKGVALDQQTRCAHYHSALDIIAIKMACCQTYYACKDCHEEIADHDLQVWPLHDRDMPAVLCGACRHELTIEQYLHSGSRCPHCSADFNSGCEKHYHFYFAA